MYKVVLIVMTHMAADIHKLQEKKRYYFMISVHGLITKPCRDPTNFLSGHGH